VRPFLFSPILLRLSPYVEDMYLHFHAKFSFRTDMVLGFFLFILFFFRNRESNLLEGKRNRHCGSVGEGWNLEGSNSSPVVEIIQSQPSLKATLRSSMSQHSNHGTVTANAGHYTPPLPLRITEHGGGEGLNAASLVHF
jgi:hypothetical protein